MATDILIDLRETADLLTDPRHHREPRYGLQGHHRVIIGHHITTQPGLLQQLADMAYPGASEDEDSGGGRSVPESRPPGDVDAISAYVVITLAVARWCWSLKLDLRDSVESNLRQAVATVIGREDRDTQIALLGEMRTWRNQCETITGWKEGAKQLKEPCPHCGERQLRVKHEGPTARCYACHVEWGPEALGVLGRVLDTYRIDATAKADEARRAARQRQDARDGRAAPNPDASTPGPRVAFPAWVRSA